MSRKGNKGEWSELYVLFRLLSTGIMYAADEEENIIPDVSFPVSKVLRDEGNHGVYEYTVNTENGDIIVTGRDYDREILKRDKFARAASYIYEGILNGKGRSFDIPSAENFLNNIHVFSIKASPDKKTDISLVLHDYYTGMDRLCGFSVKSKIGGNATLLNASGATNFRFGIDDMSDCEMDRINAISTDKKILSRVKAINDNGGMSFEKTANDCFRTNLMFMDSYMEEIIAEMLMDYYSGGPKDCTELVRRLEDRNPLGYPRRGLYEYKFKQFLCSTALGMKPSKPWDGIDEANGGCVIVRPGGQVIVYPLYNRNAFESYLFNNTKFDHGSSKKHGFATIFKTEDGKKHIDLNLQIRFK